jgi:hypothetical protein
MQSLVADASVVCLLDALDGTFQRDKFDRMLWG